MSRNELSTLETLKAARELISDSSRWTQGEYARTPYNDETCEEKWAFANAPSACCWCSTGALAKVQNLRTPDWTNSLEAAFEMSESMVERFNDSHTHAEVLAMYDAAIAREAARHA